MWDAPCTENNLLLFVIFRSWKSNHLDSSWSSQLSSTINIYIKISEEHMLNISFYWFLMQMLMYVCFIILSLSHTTTYSLFIFFSNIKSEGNPCVINVNSQKRFFSHFLHSMIPNLFLKPINNVKICQICIK